MKRKKGFIFIETLVVVAILTLSLVLTYASFNSAISQELIRIHYNDSAYMYRTYYLSQFLRNFRLDLVANNLNSSKIITQFSCDKDNIFDDNTTMEKSLCNNLFELYRISGLYLAKNDLSSLQNCTSSSGICENLYMFGNDNDFPYYVQTIGGAGKTGYRIIVKYSENQDGSFCSEDENINSDTNKSECIFNYTTLSLGEI